jgi:hypothetical protein
VRLLIVTQFFWPENFRVSDVVGALVDRGHEGTTLTGEPNCPDGRIFPASVANPKNFEILEGAARLVLNYLSVLVSASVLAAWLLRETILIEQPYPITLYFPIIVLGRLKARPVIRRPINALKTSCVIRPSLTQGVGRDMGSFIQSDPQAYVWKLAVARYEW